MEPPLDLKEVFKVHCIGATADFEGCADWSKLGELLEAAGLNIPQSVEITLFGNEQNFVLPAGVRSWSSMQRSFGSSDGLQVHIDQLNELYHAREREVPDVALLCHPGFDNYKEIWHPTMSVLLRANVPVIAVGHSNFFVASHDAIMHQDAGLEAMGATIIKGRMLNPFCHAYCDPTKGSLLSAADQDHKHCNLAYISIAQGGRLRPLHEVDAFFDTLDYVAVSTMGFPAFQALGPMLHDGPLRLKYPQMSDQLREAALQLLRDLLEGGTRFPSTAPELKRLFSERGLAGHYNRGRGNW